MEAIQAAYSRTLRRRILGLSVGSIGLMRVSLHWELGWSTTCLSVEGGRLDTRGGESPHLERLVVLRAVEDGLHCRQDRRGQLRPLLEADRLGVLGPGVDLRLQNGEPVGLLLSGPDERRRVVE